MRKKTILAIRIANIAALVLCVFWFFISPGFEPVVTAVLIAAGFLAPLKADEKNQDTNTPAASRSTLFNSANLDSARSIHSDNLSKNDQSPPLSLEKTNEYVPAPDNFSTFSIEQMIEACNRNDWTDLKKSIFREKQSGKFARWTGVILSISKLSEQRADSQIYVALRPQFTTENSHKNMASALFDNSHKDDLVDIEIGDVVEIEGKLAFSELFNGTPRLYDAKILRKLDASRA